MALSEAQLRSLNVSRRVIYALVAAAVVLPYLLPAPPLKFAASEPVVKVYDRMEGLKAGSHVLLAFDFDPASQAELEPMARALLKHCFRKGLVPVVVTHWFSGLDMDRRICEETAAFSGAALGKPLQNGKDWVFLGYRPGAAMLVVNMGVNLKSAFEKDFYGQPTQPMEALKGVNSLKNIDLAVDLAGGDPGVEMWIVYGSDKAGFPLAAGTTAVSTPTLYPFYNTGQIIGLLGGLRGAADYESLAKVPGGGIQGMVAQSAAHLLMIVLILGANVRYLARRLAGGRKE